MSTIEPCTQGVAVPKHIGRRVLEIMEERGKAFTQQALAIRIGMNKQTLSKKLRGERDLYLFELRRIADALHISLDRVLQEDTRDDEKLLNSLFEQLESPQSDTSLAPNLNQILSIAEKLASISVGIAERTKTLTDLGRAHYLLQHFEKATEVWLAALEYSKKMLGKYGDKESYQLLLSNLLLSATVTEDYSKITELLSEIEKEFCSDPVRLGIVCYTRAKIAEIAKDIEESKRQAYKSLEFLSMTGSARRIGKAEATAAHYEFLDGNYPRAKELLESSISHLRPYHDIWLRRIVDYAKTLIKLGENDLAKSTILEALSSINSHEIAQSDALGKLLILLSVCTNNNEFAEKVLGESQYSVPVRELAFKFLKKQCIRLDDEKSLMKYTVIEGEFGINPDDILDEEVL